MNRDKSQRHSGGQILIESIVAISIGLVGVLGFMLLLARSAAVGKDIGAEASAAYLAAEGIEMVKSIVDGNYTKDLAWNDGLGGGTYEMAYGDTAPVASSGRRLCFHGDTGLYDYDNGGGCSGADEATTTYRREIMITSLARDGVTGDDEMKVISVVRWTARGGEERSVSVENHFFDWRP